ncbi:Hypothetical predicted protein [Mytilus galloprovincialis]|uniref:Ig-like domain-containing protein n=1 Tax=Mytilus galloprovincialis TaxID=29158 RepID=A0A8B6CMM1_MYTGA|nr:Hypothetical predicted protein [Mytilus galloprovincialis]
MFFVEFQLITSSANATTGIDFEFTCLNLKSTNYPTLMEISRDTEAQCIAHVTEYEGCFFWGQNRPNSCICKNGTLILTIPGTFDINWLHRSRWTCGNQWNGDVSNLVMLYVNIPISKLNLRTTPSDENPIKVVSSSQQRFICTTDAGRPAARIQWYLSGTDITDEASPQPGICNTGCETVISSSVLLYIGNIADNGKIIYCTAVNVEGQSVNSTMRSVDILFPITMVNLTATPTDENPIKVVSGSQQRFICTTDSGKPLAKIQWYLSGTNITDEASPQPSICSAGCETVISSSILSYIGNITDNGKIIYCSAVNVEGQSVNSTMKSIDILYEPLITQIPNINIIEGNLLAVYCNVVSNPDPTYLWWTRQKNPDFRLYNANLTISNIHRNDSDSYTCHAKNILTPSGMSPQERTSQKMFDVNVQYEPVITQIPDFNITEGRTITINSTTDANPEPFMVWWTRQNVTGLVHNGVVLSISSIQRQQSDIYTFHAMNILTPSGLPFQNRTSRKSFQINVQYPPTVNMYPGYNPYILYEGQQNIKLTCVIIDANPTVDIMYNWTNAGAPINGQVMSITNVLRKDNGQYSCTAINMIGISNTISKRLDIQYQPEISDIQDYNVTEGNTLIIFPIISANPQPTLFWWSRQNEPEVGYNSTYLKISNIQRKSSGYHTFHVRNILTPSGMPSQERNSKKIFHVNVQYQPAISEIQDHNVTEGNDLQIYPVIDANPQPALLWWTSQNNFTYYGNNLTITNVQRNSSGNYTCHVMNTLTPTGKSLHRTGLHRKCFIPANDCERLTILTSRKEIVIAIYPEIDANPRSTFCMVESPKLNPTLRYYTTNFTINNIQRKSSGSYIFYAVNRLTPSGMPSQKRTSQKMCYVNVQLSTGAIAQGTSATSDNSVIIGAGVGAAVIFISILVIGVLIFISRKRQINRKKEDSNERAYESTPTGPGPLSNREMHVYNDLETVKGGKLSIDLDLYL